METEIADHSHDTAMRRTKNRPIPEAGNCGRFSIAMMDDACSEPVSIPVSEMDHAEDRAEAGASSWLRRFVRLPCGLPVGRDLPTCPARHPRVPPRYILRYCDGVIDTCRLNWRA